jgi:hypothetical protein
MWPSSVGLKNMNLLAVRFTLVFFLAYSSTLKMEANIPTERRLTFNGLSGVISQKAELKELNDQINHKTIFFRNEFLDILMSRSEMDTLQYTTAPCGSSNLFWGVNL